MRQKQQTILPVKRQNGKKTGKNGKTANGKIFFLINKPIEPTPSTLKADLTVFVNSNVLITNIIGKSALEYVGFKI